MISLIAGMIAVKNGFEIDQAYWEIACAIEFFMEFAWCAVWFWTWI